MTSIFLEVKGEVRASKPDERWYSRKFTDYMRKVLEADQGWAWSFSMGGYFGLRPGTSASGFKLHSQGLPAIVRVWIDTRRRNLGVGEETPEEVFQSPVFAHRMPMGVTVGPDDSLHKLTVQEHLKFVQTAVTVGFEQGWMGEDAAKYIRPLLDSMMKAADGNDQRAFDSSMQELLAFVEGNRGKLLLSEAYGLLKLNLASIGEKINRVASPSAVR